MKILYYILCFTLVQATCFAAESKGSLTFNEKMTLYLGIFLLFAYLKKISESVDPKNKDQNKSNRRPADPSDPIIDQYQKWKNNKNQDQASKNAEAYARSVYENQINTNKDLITDSSELDSSNKLPYLLDIENLNRSRYEIGGVSCSKNDYVRYLSELRKPKNYINEKLVEAHLTGFISKIKNQAVNAISFVKINLNKRSSTIINEKSESIEVLPCAEGGVMIESVDLSTCPFYNCPHCWEFSIIETSMGCNWRQQMDVECPRCSKKLRDKKSAKKTRHPLPARAGREKLGRSRIFQWTGYPSALVFEPGRIRLPPTEGLIRLPPRILRRHRLRLSPEGLSIGVINLRWIDIGDIIASDNVIEIFVVPIRQGPHSYKVMRFMKTSCYLEVPAHRKSEIESAIRQFMARWKVPLKGKFTIAK